MTTITPPTPTPASTADGDTGITGHSEARVNIQGPSFRTGYCHVGYRHDNGPAWDSRPDYAPFDTAFGKIWVGSYHRNMYGHGFSVGDRISAGGGASIRVIKPASPAPNPANPVPPGEIYILGTHNYHSEQAGPRDGEVEVTLDQALIDLLPEVNAALAAGAVRATLGYTRSFAPTVGYVFPEGEEAKKAVRVAIDAARTAVPKVAEEPVEHSLFPGVKIPPAMARVLDARGLREVSRTVWEGKGGEEVRVWIEGLTDAQFDWVSGHVEPRASHAEREDGVRKEWETLKREWEGKPFPTA